MILICFLNASGISDKKFKSEDYIAISKITSDHPAVQASFKQIEQGRLYVIKVKVDPAKISKDLRAFLNVETSSAEHDSISVSVYGVLPPKA